MTQMPCDSIPADALNVIQLRPVVKKLLPGGVTEEESFEFMMRVLSLIRAERSVVMNDNAGPA